MTGSDHDRGEARVKQRAGAPRTLATALGRAAKPILALAGVALLGVMLSRLSRAELAAALRRVGPAGAWTLLLWLGTMLANTLSLRALLPAKVPLRGLWRNRFISESYNNLLPLLGVGGEAFKVRHLARHVAVEVALAATVQERIVDALVDYVFSAALVGVGLATLPLSPGGRDAAWAGVALSAVLSVLALAALWRPLSSRVMARVARWLGAEAPAATTASSRALVISAAWNLAGRVISMFEAMLLLHLLGHPAPLAVCCFMQGAQSVVGTIAWFIPGALGAAEAGTVLIFGWLGLPAADGMALALVRRARLVLTSSFGVALYALERRRR
jgi:hypothetical protein